MPFSIDIIQIIFLIIILWVSIGLHEYAHAFSSFRLGDPTPQLQKRLTPNPLYHIDPIWFLAIFIIHFWWWKPVQVNPAYYKKPIRDELIVALSGPFTNFLLAIIGIIILVIYIKFAQTGSINDFGWWYFVNFRSLFSIINLGLAIFNLIPLPPLDWFRLIKFFKPLLANKILQYQLQIAIGFLLIIFFTPGIIWNVIWTTINFLFKTLRILISSLLL